ncbi:MAG: hypothetical protein KAS53_08490 [Candidatus Cloacimonetes bacterium]|nr:hypothetical protein [Candidatus Cloacimonadota bacterium]
MNKYLIVFILFLSTLLTAEKFNIEEFSKPAKYNWKTLEDRFKARNDLESRQKLLQIYELNKQQIVTNMIKSALVPGWGHYSSRDYTKGHAFIASAIVLFGTSYYFYNQGMDDYRNYKDSHYIGDIKQHYLDANSNFKYSLLFLSLGAIIRLYTIYDSISATQEYNQTLWDDLSKKLHSQRVLITPTSITVRF